MILLWNPFENNRFFKINHFFACLVLWLQNKLVKRFSTTTPSKLSKFSIQLSLFDCLNGFIIKFASTIEDNGFWQLPLNNNKRISNTRLKLCFPTRLPVFYSNCRSPKVKTIKVLSQKEKHEKYKMIKQKIWISQAI